MTDPTTDDTTASDVRPDHGPGADRDLRPGRELRPERDPRPERDLRPGHERARFVAACYVAAFRAIRVLAASAASLTTLALLALVQRLVETPTVQFAGATVPLTQVVAGAVLAVLAKRLYDLNVASDSEH